ncbi:hypothetical protein NPX13_g594 [Xylaria arbuscula]|uniref:Signal sequence receptor subunit alpha n=1 Tax=Xylaria arbuscula TaxID=114810 RepID=A0A9W8TRX7_9PEZI|nr:hypothetical protein NPX13_g594 [Xylaria arbuscula]
MVAFRYSVLATLALRVLSVFAQEGDVPPVVDDETTPNVAAEAQLNAEIVATFPEADIFGVKLVNGRPTKAVIDITNNEDEPIQVAFLGGQLMKPEELSPDAPAYTAVLRNLSTVQYQATNSRWREAVATLLLCSGYAASGRSATPYWRHHGWFQQDLLCCIFLYLVLTGAFAGTCYFVYKTYIEAFFPQTKKPRAPKKVKPTFEKEPLSGGEGTASGNDKVYDESWIPAEHLNRPTARRVKSSASGKLKSKNAE